MIGADANILLRLLLNDDAEQVATVRQRLEQVAAARGTIQIGPIALAETIWTLAHRAKVPKDALAHAIRDLGLTRPFSYFNDSVVEAALAMFESGKAGFSDCLIRAMDAHAGCTETLTFDQRAVSLPGFTHP